MLRLLDRQKQIPNGLRFYLPQIKFTAPGNYPSFTVICNALEQAIKANPFLAQKHGWPTDRRGIEDWVDTYNAALCARMGWDSYITSGEVASVPKYQPQHQQETLRSLAAAAAVAKSLVAGAKTLTEWIDSGDAPVNRDLAQNRASTCVACPKNEAGDWTKWFTVPASEMIRRQVQKATDRSISTIYDEKLNLCSVCHCPLRLKVHVPIEWIVKRLSPETLAKLKAVPNCWIPHESP